MSNKIKVAIAHDYLTQRGGAEKVVLAMARAFPDAPIYTTLYEPSQTYPEFKQLDVRSSQLNRIGFFRRNHRAALPLLPFVSSAIKIDADVVLTSSSGWAHGFRTTGKKVVYCYSPARWIYQTDAYLGDSGGLVVRRILSAFNPVLKRWDKRAASKAGRYIAISSVVQDRIKSAYGIDAAILPAPQSMDTKLAQEAVDSISPWEGTGYYLCISRLLPYKNVDKIMRAFANVDRNLVVVGSGPQELDLESLLRPNIKMVKNLSDGQIRWLYANCLGLIAASYEDFGLTPLEAASYGKPSAALRWGGFLDTVAEGRTGVYFDQPDPEQIALAVKELESRSWLMEQMEEHLDRFSEARFAEALNTAVQEAFSPGAADSFPSQKENFQ